MSWCSNRYCAFSKPYYIKLRAFLIEEYRGTYLTLQVGTGDAPSTISFYEKCGFVRSHIVPNFFTDHYDHPIYDGGVLLVDMVLQVGYLILTHIKKRELET